MANVPISNLTTTWNDGATTFTGVKLNVTDTASASGSLLMDLQVGGGSKFKVDKSGGVVVPSAVAIKSDGANATKLTLTDGFGVGTGLSLSGYNQTAAVLNLYMEASGEWTSRLRSNASLSWSDHAINAASGTRDLILARDAAGVLAQRNSTNAQTFRVYNTYTDASNYERAKIAWDTNVLKIGTEKAGTGTARALELQTDGTTRGGFGAGGGFFVKQSDGTTNRFAVSLTPGNNAGVISDGNQFIYRDASTSHATVNRKGYVSAEGTTDPSQQPGLHIYRSRAGSPVNSAGFGFGGIDSYACQVASTTWTIASYLRITSTQAHSNTALGTRMAFGTTPNDSTTVAEVFALEQSGLVSFGGSTSFFPALKRSSTTLQARLADDSDYGSLQGKLTTETAYAAGDPTTTGYLVLYDSTGTAYKVPAVAV